MERYIKVINNGRYRGYIKIDDTKIDYELFFGNSISYLDIIDPTEKEKEIHQLYRLTISRDNTNIELTNKEYGFFFGIIIRLAIDLYDKRLIRNNEMMMEMFLQDKDLGKRDHSESIVSIMDVDYYYFPQDICQMLSTAKFGCKLIDS